MDRHDFTKKYNPYGHLGGHTNFSADLRAVINNEIQKYADILFTDSNGILDIRNITKDYNPDGGVSGIEQLI